MTKTSKTFSIGSYVKEKKIDAAPFRNLLHSFNILNEGARVITYFTELIVFLSAVLAETFLN